jgi:hypothetical protein
MQQLKPLNATLSAASSCRELREVLAIQMPDMPFTDELFGDGDWRDVLDAVAGVSAVGAYDLLVEPFGWGCLTRVEDLRKEVP